MNVKRKLRSLAVLTIGGSAAFGAINVYQQNENFYKDFVMPAVHLLDPETAHRLAVFSGKYRLMPRMSFIDPDPLRVSLFSMELSNPIGIAAGFDKHGEAIQGLGDIGFGFVEVGSVTPEPQHGNERPRVFRLKEDLAVINRYGFNSEGHSAVYDRLKKLRDDPTFTGVLGINLGKNKESENAIEDYTRGIQRFADVADYLVINISSPNTPGLRNMQGKAALRELLAKVVATKNSLPGRKPPLLLKLAPDLSYEERKDVADVIRRSECHVEGLIISNTTVGRPDGLRSARKGETGGLSGAPVKDASTQMIADMYKLTKGMTIIGVGGVSTGKDAYEKIKAGASAVQIYTSMVYGGPFVVTNIKKELAGLLSDDGYAKMSEAIGKGCVGVSQK